ncbi:hypothetical protein DD238_002424 [Peronospora effusa]|uniref:RING-type domain-containing protein n=1 Tax=Peronospora effusa TaxID=542832 RepID=A0A3M6VQW8_9STRA|nr:hypothetical protein DD238_002424 [Peronospora effusa]
MTELLGKCPHYVRRCHVLAECCKTWVSCRLCHDEAFGEQHRIDRFIIKQMRCDLCLTEQFCAQKCMNCHEMMAAYFCAVCNLFDDKGIEKKVFHCDQCGICRVGGRENYYHCIKCCGCYPHSLENKHKCLEGSMHRECPICLDVTFDSLEKINVLPCGHVLHSSCFKTYVKHQYEQKDGVAMIFRTGNIVCPTCRSPFVNEDENNEEDVAGEDNSEEGESNDGDENRSSEDDEEDQEVVIIHDAESGDDSDLEMDAEHDAERNVWPGPYRHSLKTWMQVGTPTIERDYDDRDG